MACSANRSSFSVFQWWVSILRMSDLNIVRRYARSANDLGTFQNVLTSPHKTSAQHFWDFLKRTSRKIVTYHWNSKGFWRPTSRLVVRNGTIRCVLKWTSRVLLRIGDLCPVISNCWLFLVVMLSWLKLLFTSVTIAIIIRRIIMHRIYALPTEIIILLHLKVWNYEEINILLWINYASLKARLRVRVQGCLNRSTFQVQMCICCLLVINYLFIYSVA